MLVTNLFTGVRLGDSYHGMLSTFILFGVEGKSSSPTKLINRIAKKYPPRLVFFIGDVAVQDTHELAFLISDLLNLQKKVVVDLYETDILPSIDALPKIRVQIETQMPLSRFDELLWVVGPSDFDLTCHKISVPVYINPRTGKEVKKCFEILKKRPNWRYVVEESSVLKERLIVSQKPRLQEKT